MEAAMALAMLKYVPVGTSAGANLVTDALQVMRDGGCVGLARIVYIHRI
jgi:acetyl esterase/lipase